MTWISGQSSLIARVAEELRQRLHAPSSNHDPEVIERALRALHRSVCELGDHEFGDHELGNAAGSC